jgi:hypothetical protein
VFHQYLSAVQDYSSRYLSYDSDSLNAFQGIIQRYLFRSSKNMSMQSGAWLTRSDRGKNCLIQLRSELAPHLELLGGFTRTEGSTGICFWTGGVGWCGAVQIRPGDWKVIYGKNGVLSVRLSRSGHFFEDLNSLHRSISEPMCCVLLLLAKPLPPDLFTCNLATDGNMSWTFVKSGIFPVPGTDTSRKFCTRVDGCQPMAVYLGLLSGRSLLRYDSCTNT